MIEIITCEEKERLIDHLKHNVIENGYVPSIPSLVSRMYDFLAFLGDYRLIFESHVAEVDSFTDLGPDSIEAIALVELNYWKMFSALEGWRYEHKRHQLPSAEHVEREYRKLFSEKTMGSFEVNVKEDINTAQAFRNLKTIGAMRHDLNTNKYRCTRYQFVACMARFVAFLKKAYPGDDNVIGLRAQFTEQLVSLTKLAPAEMKRLSKTLK